MTRAQRLLPPLPSLPPCLPARLPGRDAWKPGFHACCLGNFAGWARRGINSRRALGLAECEAGRVTVYANDTARTDRQCRRRAKFRLDGKSLCTKHAGVTALAILLGEAPA